jgi:hypothetical protein
MLSIARIAVIAALAAVEVFSLFLASSWEVALPLAGAETIFLVLAAFLLYRNWWDWFTITSGLLVVIGVMSTALGPYTGYLWPWAMLGSGLAAIMCGNHTCRSASILTAGGTSKGPMEGEFRRVAVRGYLRILLFVGLVWIVSMFILLVSLNAETGALPSWLMAVLALIAMVALALLALARRTEG